MIIIDSVLFKQIEIFHFPRKWKSKKKTSERYVNRNTLKICPF